MQTLESDNIDDIIKEFKERIAGEIVLSENPCLTLKKWREIFNVSKLELSKLLKVSPSVLSDYERCRRKNPGAMFIKRFVNALIKLDKKNNFRVLKKYLNVKTIKRKDFIEIKEFAFPYDIEDFCKKLELELILKGNDRKIYGYTLLDSLKVIKEYSYEDFLKIFGLTSDRALIFTNVKFGRSPFIAVRISPIKPSLIVICGNIDEFGIELAKIDAISVAKCDDVNKLKEKLRCL